MWRLFENTRNELLTLHEGGGDWKRFSVNITSETEYQVTRFLSVIYKLSVSDYTNCVCFNGRQIVLEGFKGEKGVLALDDIQYTVGVNCAGQKTDQSKSSSLVLFTFSCICVTIILMILCEVKIFFIIIAFYKLFFFHLFSASSSSNNTGTIVAVVVVIVLIVLLAAFLVFYLKTKHKTNALIQESNGSRVNPTGFSNDMYESANAVSYMVKGIWALFTHPLLRTQKNAFYICCTLNVF